MLGIVPDEIELEAVLEKILPTQKEFISSGYPYASYVGGFGSGKTVALCLSAILRGEKTPGGLSLIGRLNMPALKETTRRTFLSLFPNDWCAEYRETEQKVVAKNGHEYLFRHLDLSNPEQKAHIRSLNLSAFYIDEASEISEQTYLTLVGRMRRKGVKGHYGRIVSNPAGHDWMWRLFYDNKRAPSLCRLNTGFLASSTENIHNPEEYVQNMLAVFPPDWAERYIYSSFADFSDKVYKDWNTNLHVWDCTRPQPAFSGAFDPPDTWPVIVGIDFGGVDPWAIVFIAVEPETGMLYQYDEIYGAGILVKDYADQFFEKLGNHHLEGMAYDYENKQSALELHALGIGGAPANKEQKAGIFKVGQYLHPDPRLVNPFIGTAPSPRYFVASRCENTIRELPAYAWSKDKAGNFTGKPVDGNDHTCDAVRYAIHTFRPEPKLAKPKPAWADPKLDEMSRLFWRDVWLHQQKKDGRRKRAGFSYSKMVV